MPLKYELRGRLRYAEVRLRPSLNPREHYICVCDNWTQLFVAFIYIFSVYNSFVMIYISSLFKTHLGARLQSGSVTSESLLSFHVYDGFLFYSKEMCVWCTQQINTNEENACVKVIFFTLCFYSWCLEIIKDSGKTHMHFIHVRFMLESSQRAGGTDCGCDMLSNRLGGWWSTDSASWWCLVLDFFSSPHRVSFFTLSQVAAS